MNVLYVCDNNYCPYTGVSITSLFVNNKDLKEINVYVIGLAISEENKQKFSQLATKYRRSIYLLDADEIDKFLVDKGVNAYRGSMATFYRLFIDQLLPESLDSVLYIDGDTLVVGTLSDLKSFVFDENKACAMTIQRIFEGYNGLIGLEDYKFYYNAGVIFFNLDNWRKLNCGSIIRDAIDSGHGNFRSADNDLLSLSINEHIQPLDMKYNIFSLYQDIGLNRIQSYFDSDAINFYSLCEIEDAMKNPKILHCHRAIYSNPWHRGNTNPFTHKWLEYKNLSLWSDIEQTVDKRTMARGLQRVLYFLLPKCLFYKLNKTLSKRDIIKYYRRFN